MDIMEKTQRFSRTVPCPNCGEEYSITYKRCPFCGGPPKKAAKQSEPETVRYAPSDELFRAMLQEDDPDGETAGVVSPKFPQGVHPEAQPMMERRNQDESGRTPMETVVISVGKGKDTAPEAVSPQPEPTKDIQAPPPAAVSAAQPPRAASVPPARAAVAVLPTEIDIDLPELDFSDIDESMAQPTAKGGKRLQGKGRGGGVRSSGEPSPGKKGGGFGKFIGVLFSLLIVAAAVYIVGTKALPYIQTYLDQREQGVIQNEGTDPAGEPAGEPEVVIFQLADAQVTLTAKDATQTLIPVFEGTEADPEIGTLTWESSNPAVVTVSGEGKLTAVNVGDAIVSVTRANGEMANCQVVCQWEEGEIIPSNLYLNKEDFTLKSGESFTMKVIGTDAPAAWSIDKPNVATISKDGEVKYVSQGRATITCTVGNFTLTCIVRCK